MGNLLVAPKGPPSKTAVLPARPTGQPPRKTQLSAEQNDALLAELMKKFGPEKVSTTTTPVPPDPKTTLKKTLPGEAKEDGSSAEVEAADGSDASGGSANDPNKLEDAQAQQAALKARLAKLHDRMTGAVPPPLAETAALPPPAAAPPPPPPKVAITPAQQKALADAVAGLMKKLDTIDAKSLDKQQLLQVGQKLQDAYANMEKSKKDGKVDKKLLAELSDVFFKDAPKVLSKLGVSTVDALKMLGPAVMAMGNIAGGTGANLKAILANVGEPDFSSPKKVPQAAFVYVVDTPAKRNHPTIPWAHNDPARALQLTNQIAAMKPGGVVVNLVYSTNGGMKSGVFTQTFFDNLGIGGNSLKAVYPIVYFENADDARAYKNLLSLGDDKETRIARVDFLADKQISAEVNAWQKTPQHQATLAYLRDASSLVGPSAADLHFASDGFAATIRSTIQALPDSFMLTPAESSAWTTKENRAYADVKTIADRQPAVAELVDAEQKFLTTIGRVPEGFALVVKEAKDPAAARAMVEFLSDAEEFAVLNGIHPNATADVAERVLNVLSDPREVSYEVDKAGIKPATAQAAVEASPARPAVEERASVSKQDLVLKEDRAAPADWDASSPASPAPRDAKPKRLARVGQKAQEAAPAMRAVARVDFNAGRIGKSRAAHVSRPENAKTLFTAPIFAGLTLLPLNTGGAAGASLSLDYPNGASLRHSRWMVAHETAFSRMKMRLTDDVFQALELNHARPGERETFDADLLTQLSLGQFSDTTAVGPKGEVISQAAARYLARAIERWLERKSSPGYDASSDYDIAFAGYFSGHEGSAAAYVSKIDEAFGKM